MGASRWRRELDRDPARRITPRRRAIGCLMALAMVLAACADSSGTSGHRGVPSSDYWGGHPPDPHVTIPDLPAAAPTPAGSLDDAAAALAAGVEAGDDSSLPSILTALNLAGIAVLDNDGSVMRPAAAPGSGISIDRWEVVALGMFARSRAAVSLKDLTSNLASQVPALAGTPLGAWILDGLRTNAQSSRPQARFLARFVIELARQNPYAPTDILAATPPADAVLDGVATELVLRRLAADIFAFATRIHASPVPFAAAASPSATAMHVNGAGQIQLAEAAGPAAPCTIEEKASKILDATAVGFTTAFDKLTERLVEWMHGSAAIEGLKNFGAVANIVLALAKLLAYYSALDVKVEMQSAPPLTRTKSTTAGEKKTLIATARLDPTKNLQMINCIRIVLNFLGMDVSMPQSGAIADSEANWVLVKGGAGAGGSTTGQIVRFTRADASNPGSGDPAHQRTDENGKTSIGIEGSPQRRPIPASAPPVNKDAEVWVAVQPKPPNFYQDLIDASVGFSPGLGLIGVAPVETLLRTNVLKPAEYPFKVIDWAAMFRLDFETTVTGDVGGTMHFVSHVKFDSMILGDPSQGNALPGTDGLNNAAYGGTDIAYDFTLHWFCAHSDSGPIDPADVKSVDHGPPAVAGLFYDTASGDVTNLRLALSPGSPTETIHCPGLDVTRVYHDFVEGFSLLHSGGPCPGIQAKNTGEPIFFVCGLLKTGDGVWTRSFHGPGNKADFPGPLSFPLPPGFGASEDTTITLTQLGG